MKYTRTNGQLVEVTGCTTCPHKENHSLDGVTFMKCKAPTLQADGTYRQRSKKLIGNWYGGYHASCPLANTPEQVPILKEDK